MNASFVNSSNTYDWEFIFQGLRTDKNTSIIHNRHRDLDPLLGRFLQRDPLGHVDGANLYSAYHVVYSGVDWLGLAKDAMGDGPPCKTCLSKEGDACCKRSERMWENMGFSDIIFCEAWYQHRHGGINPNTIHAIGGANLAVGWVGALKNTPAVRNVTLPVAAFSFGYGLGKDIAANYYCNKKVCAQGGTWKCMISTPTFWYELFGGGGNKCTKWQCI